MRIDSALHLDLQCHSSTPSGAVRNVSVDLRSSAATEVQVKFTVDAAEDALAIPAPRSSAFKDGLWRHTCFELFAASADGAYREFNFSPSTEFAIYDFTAYRTAVTAGTIWSAPSIHSQPGGLSARIELPSPVKRMGIAAVIEERNGTLSYWAVRHAAEKPDFHHHESFIIEWPLRAAAGEYGT